MTEHDDTTPTEDSAYDPADDTVAGVLEVLTHAGADERVRILDAERQGKARQGILNADVPLAPTADEGTEDVAWVPIDLDGNPIPGAVHDPEPRAD